MKCKRCGEKMSGFLWWKRCDNPGCVDSYVKNGVDGLVGFAKVKAEKKKPITGMDFGSKPSSTGFTAFTKQMVDAVSKSFSIPKRLFSNNHNKGWFRDMQAIRGTFPNPRDGDYAIDGSCDKIIVAQNGEWQRAVAKSMDVNGIHYFTPYDLYEGTAEAIHDMAYLDGMTPGTGNSAKVDIIHPSESGSLVSGLRCGPGFSNIFKSPQQVKREREAARLGAMRDRKVNVGPIDPNNLMST